MTTSLPSVPHRRARLGRTLDVAALERWPTVDATQIQNSDKRKRFEDLKTAVELYAGGMLVREVVVVAKMTPRWFYRLLDRCVCLAPDGKPWGFRALVSRTARRAPVRVKVRDANSRKPSAGYGGYFRKLLRDRPEIERGLVSALMRMGKDRLMPNTLDFRGVHRAFIRECERAGLTETDYPLNTESRARVPLHRWLKGGLHVQARERVVGLGGQSRCRKIRGLRAGNGARHARRRALFGLAD